MSRITNRLKPVFLLISMALVCVGIVWVTNQFKSISAYSSEKVVTNETVVSNEVVDIENASVMGDTSIPLEVKKEKPTDEEPDTTTSTQYSCKSGYFTEIKTESICKINAEAKERFYKDPDGAKLLGGGRVSVDADIMLIKVTIPLELFSGIEVANSNRLITTETPTLKPAGEQIDSSTANVLLPPGQQIDTYKGWDEEKPFKSKYSTAFSDNLEKPSETGSIGVETELANDCEESCPNNKSNVNPDKSNTISEFMQDSLYRIPGEKGSTIVETIDECAQNRTFIPWEWEDTTEYVACRANVFTETIQRFHNISGWGTLEQIKNIIKCGLAGDNDPDCIKTEYIVVIMSSPFGSDEECAEGSACTNTYMETRNSIASVPSTDLGPKQYYVTPCDAFIQGLRYKVTIKCAWDMSHLYKERKANEFDDVPTVDSTPTDEEYEKFLEEEVKGTRGVERPIQ